MTTTNTATTEAVAHLETQGFTRIGARLYDHPCGYTRVEVVDDESVCFIVYAFTRDQAQLRLWEVQLNNVPLAVFAATISAAIA